VKLALPRAAGTRLAPARPIYRGQRVSVDDIAVQLKASVFE
jgi:hypothetical protein